MRSNSGPEMRDWYSLAHLGARPQPSAASSRCPQRHLRVAFLPFVQVIVKARRPLPYPDNPTTLGEHLKGRRVQLKLRQKDAANSLRICHQTYINWEKGLTLPKAHAYPPIIAFLGYDPTPPPQTLADRVRLKRQELGATFSQVAQYLGWDGGTLTRYLNSVWPIPAGRQALLEAFLAASRDELTAIHRLPRRAPRR